MKPSYLWWWGKIGAILTSAKQNTREIEEKTHLLCSKAHISGLEAPIDKVRDSFENLRSSAFIWAPKLFQSDQYSLSKSRLKLATLTILQHKNVRYSSFFNFKRNLLREYWSDLKNLGAHMKAEDLRISKLSWTLSIGASKPEIWVFKQKKMCFFLYFPCILLCILQNGANFAPPILWTPDYHFWDSHTPPLKCEKFQTGSGLFTYCHKNEPYMMRGLLSISRIFFECITCRIQLQI